MGIDESGLGMSERPRVSDARYFAFLSYLIDKRKPEGLLGGLWEFPGGKKNARESFKQALKREVREELDIEIQVNQKQTIRITIMRFHYQIPYLTITGTVDRV